LLDGDFLGEYAAAGHGGGDERVFAARRGREPEGAASLDAAFKGRWRVELDRDHVKPEHAAAFYAGRGRSAFISLDLSFNCLMLFAARPFSSRIEGQPDLVLLASLVIACATLAPSLANCASALFLFSTHLSYNRRFLCAGYDTRRRFAMRCSIAEFTLSMLSDSRLATWPNHPNGAEIQRATTRHSAAS
jgi:hypothetical protein